MREDGDSLPDKPGVSDLTRFDEAAVSRLTASTLLGAGRFEEACRHLEKLVALENAQPGDYYALGLASSRIGNNERAASAFRTAAHLGVRRLPLFGELGRVLFALGDMNGAAHAAAKGLELAETLRSAHPVRSVDEPIEGEDSYALRLLHGVLVKCFEQAGDLSAQREHYDALLRIGPDTAAVRYGAARAERLLGNLPASAEHLERAVALDPGYADAWRLRGTVQHLLGNLEEAKRSLERAIQLGRSNRETHIELADVLLARGAIDDAMMEGNTGLDLAKDDESRAAAHWILGRALAAKSRHQPSHDHLMAAARLDPSWAEYHYHLGLSYWEEEAYHLARSCFARATELAPGVPTYWSGLGFAALRTGDTVDARTALEHSLAIGESDPDARLTLIRVLIAVGDFDAALREAREGLRATPDDAALHWSLAEALRLRGEMDAAARHAERAVELSPTVENQFTLAQILLDIGRMDAAETLAKGLLASGGGGQATVLLVSALTRQGKLEEALEVARRAEGVGARGDPDAVVALGLALAASGHEAEACEAFVRAEEMDPGNPWLEWARTSAIYRVDGTPEAEGLP